MSVNRSIKSLLVFLFVFSILSILPYSLSLAQDATPQATESDLSQYANVELPAAFQNGNRPKVALVRQLADGEFFTRYPWAGLNFIAYARAVHRALKRCARRAVSLAYAQAA